MLPERDADPSPPSSAKVYKESKAIPLLSLRVFVACKNGETPPEEKMAKMGSTEYNAHSYIREQ
jgi:hypothetical protein